MPRRLTPEQGNTLAKTRSPMVGILLFYLSAWFLSSLDASGKWVMALGTPLLVFCWFRYLVHVLFILCIALPSKGLGVLKPKLPKMQLLRGVAMLSATLSFFTTLSYLHQAEATAIVFMSPLLILLVAPWLLKEPAQPSRWLAAIAGFVGLLIIIRPSAGLPAEGVGFGLLTACLFACQHIATRKLAKDEAFTTLLWSGATGVLLISIALPIVLPQHWEILEQFDTVTWCILLSCGISGGIGQMLQILAYRTTPASLLAPFLYLHITAAASIGWLVWGHFPDALTWLGIGIISASGVINALAEWHRTKVPKTPNVI